LRHERDIEEHRDRRAVEAAGLFELQRQRLSENLAQTREDRRRHLVRLRAAEADLKETSRRITALEAAEQESEGLSQVLDAAALREHRQLLAQEQIGLAEQLLELTSTIRKLQVAIRQSQAIADYLLGESEELPSDELSVESTQLRALDVQEEERQRLAREIHDGPTQVLVNAIFVLSSISRQLDRNPEKARNELLQLEADLRDGLAEVRRFIFDLRPAQFGELGLAATLQQYVESYRQRSGASVTFLQEGEIPRLSSAKEAAIFRIFQEALQNARKHSGASAIRVVLAVEDCHLLVSVEDDGRGFDPDEVVGVAGRHFGLQSMRERAGNLRGNLEVRSRPGEGTSIVLHIPVGGGTDLSG
jgi:two-component system, NarL family, sensor histidine kinase DegS